MSLNNWIDYDPTWIIEAAEKELRDTADYPVVESL